MSIACLDGSKAVLPRDREAFWSLLEQRYARRHRQRWRWLAGLALRYGLGWRLESIALAMDCTTGTAKRGIDRIRADLADEFQPPDRPAHGLIDGAGI